MSRVAHTGGMVSVIVSLMMIANCGKTGSSSSSSVALVVTLSPNPVPFITLPARGQPGQPPPPCCPTLVADWTLTLQATADGVVDFIRATVRNASTGAVVVSAQFDRERILHQGGATRIRAGQRVALPQQLLEPVASPFTAADGLTIRVEAHVIFSDGEPVVGTAEVPLIPGQSLGESVVQ